MDQYGFDPMNAAGGEDDTGQRSASRDSLLLTAQLRVAGDPLVTQVRVRNLSAGGLMAEYPVALASGTSVEVDVRGVGWVRGRIAWAAEGRVGIAFIHPIDPKLARKPVGQGTSTPVYAKPIITRR